MFLFWNSEVGKMPENGSGKLVPKSKDFGHSLVSFRPGNLTISRISELTSDGWNFWTDLDPGIFSRRLVSFRSFFLGTG